MTGHPKNRPHGSGKNRPHDGAKKHPDIINPVPLSGVIDERNLRELLRRKKQPQWCSAVRVKGLLLLIDYCCRHMTANGVTISGELARSYVSRIKRIDPADITEPLLLLCQIGILKLLRPAVWAHIRISKTYAFAADFEKTRLRLVVSFTPKLASKLVQADLRLEQGLNRKYAFRKQLLADLSGISFAPSARPIIASGLRGVSQTNLVSLVRAVDGPNHSVKISERGQITTSLGSCPRALQPHLLLNGNPVVYCDISNAHWNFLPKLIKDRIAHVSQEAGREKYVADATRELQHLVDVLSNGDFYQKWCVNRDDLKEREEKKRLLNMLLNQSNPKCEGNVLYRAVRRTFPITFAVVEDLRRQDNRNLSIQLQRFTADTLSGALLEVQAKGIAAIPLVDSVICERQHRSRVCDALGKAVFSMTGGCCKVGGIRYSPLTPAEARALAFDECEPSNERISYDEWEAIRKQKCVAALKILFPLQWFSPAPCCQAPNCMPILRDPPTAATSCAA